MGAVLGSVIHFDTTGIEFVMTALFFVMFLDQWEASSRHLPALIGVVCSLACLSVLHAAPKSGERKTLPALFHACSNTNGAHGGSATALVQEVSVPHTDRSAATKPSFPTLSASGHSFHPTGMRHKNIR